jgi:arabinose-5-phosphate isomerase
MTGRLDSTLAKSGEVVLDISVEKEACPLGKAPTASTTATLAMGDALAVCLLEKRGFTAEDFLIYHPGGALGKGIKYHVSDLMMTEDRKMPVAPEDMKFTDLVQLISDYKLGMAIITDNAGRLSGILTDGDIRRCVLKYGDLSGLVAKDVMTVNPKTVKTTDFAASALHLMEKYSITALAVVNDDNQPIGVVHIHDILKAGVV